MCGYAVCASEFNATRDSHIKTNVSGIPSCLDKVNQLRPVIFNYKNKNKYGIKMRYGLIAQEVAKIFPTTVDYTNGTIDNINTEFNKSDIVITNDLVTINASGLDIDINDKIELCDIDNDSYTTNIHTADIVSITPNTVSFYDKSHDPDKNIFISGKNVSDLHVIDYMALVPILIKSVQELSASLASLQELVYKNHKY